MYRDSVSIGPLGLQQQFGRGRRERRCNGHGQWRFQQQRRGKHQRCGRDVAGGVFQRLVIRGRGIGRVECLGRRRSGGKQFLQQFEIDGRSVDRHGRKIGHHVPGRNRRFRHGRRWQSGRDDRRRNRRHCDRSGGQQGREHQQRGGGTTSTGGTTGTAGSTASTGPVKHRFLKSEEVKDAKLNLISSVQILDSDVVSGAPLR